MISFYFFKFILVSFIATIQAISIGPLVNNVNQKSRIKFTKKTIITDKSSSNNKYYFIYHTMFNS